MSRNTSKRLATVVALTGFGLLVTDPHQLTVWSVVVAGVLGATWGWVITKR